MYHDRKARVVGKLERDEANVVTDSAIYMASIA